MQETLEVTEPPVDEAEAERARLDAMVNALRQPPAPAITPRVRAFLRRLQGKPPRHAKRRALDAQLGKMTKDQRRRAAQRAAAVAKARRARQVPPVPGRPVGGPGASRPAEDTPGQ